MLGPFSRLSGGGRQKIQFVRTVLGPHARNPAEASIGFIPISGHPAPTWWNPAPQTADPDKVLPLVVPAPVARYPTDVVTLRLDFRRHLVDRFRRLSRHNLRRLCTLLKRLRKRLVYGAPGKCFPIVSTWLSRRAADGWQRWRIQFRIGRR
jgi:hypothetical protein